MTKNTPIETSLAELEKIVEKMETGKVTLEESLDLFEKGVTLTTQCQKALNNAEQKVKILLKNNELKSYDDAEG
jgi:exodeoxyribonuclease VII small subunit